MESLAQLGRSMYWTLPTAIFFASIALLLVAMTAWQLASPTVERKGFLPMATTRGDRLFIGLLGAAWIHIAWIAGTPEGTPLWGASILAAIWSLVVMRFG